MGSSPTAALSAFSYEKSEAAAAAAAAFPRIGGRPEV